MLDPAPREGTEGDFEGAGPIDAALERVFGEPMGDLSFDFGEKLGATGEQERLGEEDEMLVAIEFPDELVVACAGEIEVRDAAEVGEAGFLAVQEVPTPGDAWAKIDFGNAEEGEAMAEDGFGEADDFGGVGCVLNVGEEVCGIGEREGGGR